MPSIGIIGRQNVGKSTLFNALIKRNKSITHDMPGVTRDMISEKLDWCEGRWELTDFPGFEAAKNMPEDEIGKVAVDKAIRQLDQFNLLVWVVNRKGLSAFEYELLDKVRKLKKPVWLAVNFVDDPSLESDAAEFYSLGFSRVFFISALNNRNIAELKNAIIKQFDGVIKEKTDELPVIKVSLIGKPNAGKSTFFNQVLGKERSLVYNKPGTTRDTIEEKLVFQNVEILLSDTAGIRRKKTAFEAVEVFSVARTKKAIKKADVVLAIIDAQEGFDHQNKFLLEYIEEENKPAIVLLNKSDLIDDEKRGHLEDDVERLRQMFWDFPVYWISALSAKKSGKILNEAIEISKVGNEKIPTPRLNNILEILNRNPVVSSNGLKFNYITQAYPEKKFIIFSNRPAIPENVRRYLRHNLLRHLGWKRIPLQLDIRKKQGKPAKHKKI